MSEGGLQGGAAGAAADKARISGRGKVRRSGGLAYGISGGLASDSARGSPPSITPHFQPEPPLPILSTLTRIVYPRGLALHIERTDTMSCEDPWNGLAGRLHPLAATRSNPQEALRDF